MVSGTIYTFLGVRLWSVYRYKSARERLSPEQRSEIARHAAMERAMQRGPLNCSCGHTEGDHWSIGARECRACEIDERPNPCLGYTPGV
jgi:hypothetical protein